MKSTAWTAVSVGTGALAAIAMRKLVAAVWERAMGETPPGIRAA